MSVIILKKDNRFLFMRKPFNIVRLDERTVDCKYGLVNNKEVKYDDEFLKKNSINQIRCAKDESIVIVLTLIDRGGSGLLSLYEKYKEQGDEQEDNQEEEEEDENPYPPKIEVRKSISLSTYVSNLDTIVGREKRKFILLDSEGMPVSDEDGNPKECEIEDFLYEAEIPIFDKERQLIEGNLIVSFTKLIKPTGGLSTIMPRLPPSCEEQVSTEQWESYVSYWPSFGR